VSLARDLVVLETGLRDGGLINLFSPSAKSEITSLPECAAMIDRFSAFPDSVDALRICLQSLQIQREELAPKLIDAELVATLPAGVPGLARPTQSILIEMITRATREIIVLGYEFTDPSLVRLLADARGLGRDVIIICDRTRGTRERVRECWPSNRPTPRLFHDRQREDSARYASMHAKCLLIDGSDLLITSANFTFHGLHGNIEIGIRISGTPAEEARKIFSHLVESGLVESC
jgi:phosphatidylserine/phosphatidylglycerophosphate/cardiolipin synthase-like enzyme